MLLWKMINSFNQLWMCPTVVDPKPVGTQTLSLRPDSRIFPPSTSLLRCIEDKDDSIGVELDFFYAGWQNDKHFAILQCDRFRIKNVLIIVVFCIPESSFQTLGEFLTWQADCQLDVCLVAIVAVKLPVPGRNGKSKSISRLF